MSKCALIRISLVWIGTSLLDLQREKSASSAGGYQWLPDGELRVIKSERVSVGGCSGYNANNPYIHIGMLHRIFGPQYFSAIFVWYWLVPVYFQSLLCNTCHSGTLAVLSLWSLLNLYCYCFQRRAPFSSFCGRGWHQGWILYIYERSICCRLFRFLTALFCGKEHLSFWNVGYQCWISMPPMNFIS